MSIERVKELATKMGILEHSTPLKQFGKLLEEVHELVEAIESGDQDKIMNELGDVLFVLRVLDLMGSDYGDFLDQNSIECHIYEYIHSRWLHEDALTLACDKVEKRIDGGKLIDGVFVKAEDLKS